MIDETAIESLRDNASRFDEPDDVCLRQRARTAGYVARATGIARSTIDRGLKDLKDLEALDPAPPKVRRPGGGRPSLTQIDPTADGDLQRLLEPATIDDPNRPLVWYRRALSSPRHHATWASRDMGHECRRAASISRSNAFATAGRSIANKRRQRVAGVVSCARNTVFRGNPCSFSR